MAWERGFVVCKNDVADAIESELAMQGNSAQLASKRGETAFAFAGRTIPIFNSDSNSYFVCSVDDRNSGYSHSNLKAYRPCHLVPKLGLTFGISLGRRFADLRSELPDLGGPWHALGPESDCGISENLTTFRWDLDDCEFDDPQVRSRSESLKAIHRWLAERSIPHRIVVFDNGWPEVLGELSEAGDVFTGPATCLSLRWQSRSNEYNSVTANDAEFIADGDDVPDSPLWAL